MRIAANWVCMCGWSTALSIGRHKIYTLRTNIQFIKFKRWVSVIKRLERGQKKSAFDVHWVVSRNFNNVLSLHLQIVAWFNNRRVECVHSVLASMYAMYAVFFLHFFLHPLMRLSMLNKRPAPFDIELGLNTLFLLLLMFSLFELAHLIQIRCWNAISTLHWWNESICDFSSFFMTSQNFFFFFKHKKKIIIWKNVKLWKRLFKMMKNVEKMWNWNIKESQRFCPTIWAIS